MTQCLSPYEFQDGQGHARCGGVDGMEGRGEGKPETVKGGSRETITRVELSTGSTKLI